VLAGVGSATFDHSLELVLTGSIAPETATHLLESGCFAGIVEDGERLPTGDYAVLAGDDRVLVEARRAGRGVLSAAACAAPELTMALNAAIGAGDGETVTRLEGKRQELLWWLDRFPVPVGIKTAVQVRGIQTGPLPVPLSAGKQQCLEQFREWFKTWLPASKKLASHA
jgi:4-hydroxy-tetrahydrodipicolinate synthase